jgi:UDP-N-acetylglucosamine--N-acetylmuramyl-(pentapeptide) pyrophosphoryl-undecaprenol N-acetylglucosamine transferase
MSRGVALIMAGGTGGHVFPALATARVLKSRGFDIVWLGTRRGIEARLVPAEGIPVEWLSVSGLRGKGLGTLLAAPFRLVLALLQAIRAVRRHRPSVVLGAGGFASGPGGVAAWLLGRPLVVHEQNAVAGLTNRLLARLAGRVLEGFPGSFGRNVRAVHVGNPVRPEIASIAPPERRYAAREGRLRLLVFGGSQGSARLNAVVPAALAELPAALRPDVLHQTGSQGLDETVAAYRTRGIEADVRPFIDDMAGAYGWADLAVCRSGALTVAELAAAGVGAVLVPFPAAVDDHQTRNAEFAVQAGAAVLLPESRLTPRSLAERLRELLEAGRPALGRMARAARSTSVPDADQRLADACVAAAGGLT